MLAMSHSVLFVPNFAVGTKSQSTFYILIIHTAYHFYILANYSGDDRSSSRFVSSGVLNTVLTAKNVIVTHM